MKMCSYIVGAGKGITYKTSVWLSIKDCFLPYSPICEQCEFIGIVFFEEISKGLVIIVCNPVSSSSPASN